MSEEITTSTIPEKQSVIEGNEQIDLNTSSTIESDKNKDAILNNETSKMIESITSANQNNNPNYQSVSSEIWSSISGQSENSLNLQAMHLAELNQHHHSNDTNSENQSENHEHTITSIQQQITDHVARENSSSQNLERDEKPIVGSPEWHTLRRENHKQVERRRREAINKGIKEIEGIVPGCEKNKGSILQRAAVYIRQLKEAEAATVEKWTLEKLLTDQAISELNRQVEVLKVELDRVRLENNYLKRELENVNGCTHLHHGHDSKKQKLNHEE